MTSHSLIQPDFRNKSGLDKFNVIYGREVLFRFQFEQCEMGIFLSTRVGTLIVATIYLQLIQNRYMFRSFTVLQ